MKDHAIAKIKGAIESTRKLAFLEKPSPRKPNRRNPKASKPD
ncbi:MAG TPA: hypothetical protein PLI90_04040 [Rhodocyclaceae bacterium]|nr:hypothetical protein [Rhodocyclaceae bacterium]